MLKNALSSAIIEKNTQQSNKIRKPSLASDLIKNKALYLIGLPGILYFLIFCYLPMIGIIIAFKDYNVIDGIFGSKFIGFKNFEFLVKSKDIFRITYNTLFLNILFIGFGTICQVGVAILLNEVKSKFFKRINQSLILLPYFISWVVVGVFAYYIFATDNGILNQIRTAFGMKPVEWYASPQYWPAVLSFAYIWKWVGYGSIMYLAAIAGIDQAIYEAAIIDGSNKWHMIKYITIPSLFPTIIILTLLAIGRIFYGDFGMIFNIVKSNVILFSTTDVAYSGSSGRLFRKYPDRRSGNIRTLNRKYPDTLSSDFILSESIILFNTFHKYLDSCSDFLAVG